MTNNVLTEYYFSDGNKIILLDRLGMENLYGKIECARNIYLLDMYGATIWLKRRTKNAKAFHDKCENFSFRASNETAV